MSKSSRPVNLLVRSSRITNFAELAMDLEPVKMKMARSFETSGSTYTAH
jgi:hypothetical protein